MTTPKSESEWTAVPGVTAGDQVLVPHAMDHAVHQLLTGGEAAPYRLGPLYPRLTPAIEPALAVLCALSNMALPSEWLRAVQPPTHTNDCRGAMHHLYPHLYRLSRVLWRPLRLIVIRPPHLLYTPSTMDVPGCGLQPAVILVMAVAAGYRVVWPRVHSSFKPFLTAQEWDAMHTPPTLTLAGGNAARHWPHGGMPTDPLPSRHVGFDRPGIRPALASLHHEDDKRS